MRALAVVLLLICASHEAEGAGNNGSDAQETKQAAEPAKPTTPAVQGLVDTPRSEPSAHDGKTHEELDLEAQQSQAHAAWAAAIVSFLALLGLLVTWRETQRTANEAKRSADAAVEAANIGKEQNKLAREEFEFNKTQLAEGAVIAGKQLALTGLHAEIAEKQKEISRFQFFATHRPKLIVRKIMVRHELPKDLRTQEPVFFEFEVANTGGSDAVIDSLNVSMLHRLPNVAFEDDWGCEEETKLVNRTLVSGESVVARFRVVEDGDASAAVGLTITESGKESLHRLELTGTLVYEDMRGTKRTTQFRRLYNRAERRFDPSTDPDYEYAD